MSKDTINPKRWILDEKQLNAYKKWVFNQMQFYTVIADEPNNASLMDDWKKENPCPLPNPVEIREDVIWFAKEMEAKLKANDHKGTWKRETLQYLSMRLTQERKELTDAIASKDKQRIIKECADIANFAMMIADHVNLNIKQS